MKNCEVIGNAVLLQVMCSLCFAKRQKPRAFSASNRFHKQIVFTKVIIPELCVMPETAHGWMIELSKFRFSKKIVLVCIRYAFFCDVKKCVSNSAVLQVSLDGGYLVSLLNKFVFFDNFIRL